MGPSNNRNKRQEKKRKEREAREAAARRQVPGSEPADSNTLATHPCTATSSTSTSNLSHELSQTTMPPAPDDPSAPSIEQSMSELAVEPSTPATPTRQPLSQDVQTQAMSNTSHVTHVTVTASSQPQAAASTNEKNVGKARSEQTQEITKTTKQPSGAGEHAKTQPPASSTVATTSTTMPARPMEQGQNQSIVVREDEDPNGGMVDRGRPFELEDNVSDKVLLANHFRITWGEYETLFKYDLSFVRVETEEDKKKAKKIKPPKTPPRRVTVGGDVCLECDPARPKRRRILGLLMKQIHQDANHAGISFATDYFEQIITTAKIPKEAESWSEKITYRDEYTTHAVPGADEFHVILTGPTALSLSQLFRYLSTQNPDVDESNYDKQPIVRALNTIFSYRPYQKCLHQPNQPPLTPSNTFVTPKLTTKTGAKFHGIADEATPPFKPPPSGKGRGLPPPEIQTATGGACYIAPGSATIPGFSRSVRANISQHGLLTLNVNPGVSIFYQQAKTLQGLINKWWEDHVFCGSFPHDWIKELSKFLRGIHVRTNYPDGLNRPNFIGRVTKIAERINRNVYPRPSNCQMRSPSIPPLNPTVGQYFHVSDADFVMVVDLGEGSSRITFPASLLEVIPGQMNRNATEKPSAGVRTPAQNRNMLIGQGRTLFLGNNNNEGGARQFRLQLDQDLLRVPVKKLSVAPIFYLHRRERQPVTASNNTSFGGQVAAGSWNLFDLSYVAPARDFTWTCVELRLRNSHGLHSSTARDFITEFPKVLRDVGMMNTQFRPLQNHICQLTGTELPTWGAEAELDEQQEAIKNHLEMVKIHYRVKAVVLFLPSANQELYGSIKRVGDQLVGITTICHVPYQGRVNSSKDFLFNLSMKLNLKVKQNTVNQAIEPTKLGSILGGSTMVLGVDVTHPGGSAMKSSPSVAAVVGSVDDHFAQWPASLRSQLPELKPGHNPNERKQAVEKVLELEQMVKERTLAYYKRKSEMPTRVVVYRDGLSEEQFRMCQTDELPKIKEGIQLAIGELRPQLEVKNPAQLNLVPKILLICAVKRHNTRCYPVDTVEAMKDTKMLIGLNKKQTFFNTNPLPGTLITTGITYGNGRDFFLYSQNAIQGTARPTHYTILVDQIGCRSQDVAQMTHNLSYIFGRATRSTGVCAPVYYADLAADRARHYVRRVYHHHVEEGQERRTFDAATDFDLGIHADLVDQMYYI